jgi:hypothetical protein
VCPTKGPLIDGAAEHEVRVLSGASDRRGTGSGLSLNSDRSNIADFVVCLDLHHTCSNSNIVGQT